MLNRSNLACFHGDGAIGVDSCRVTVFCLLTVSLTNFVPRFGFLHLDLPIFLETFCKYPLCHKASGHQWLMAARRLLLCRSQDLN